MSALDVALWETYEVKRVGGESANDSSATYF